ncbi:hypothetical protein VIBNISFn118_1230005 [Vibrio nigripulchritudo SFn118]|nr:hypothetical protein VIBNISFn118_1230005 [Vibrio nigripulchritudo SFn118]
MILKTGALFIFSRTREQNIILNERRRRRRIKGVGSRANDIGEPMSKTCANDSWMVTYLTFLMQ